MMRIMFVSFDLLETLRLLRLQTTPHFNRQRLPQAVGRGGGAQAAAGLRYSAETIRRQERQACAQCVREDTNENRVI
jgi:hypothetical protein